MNFNFKSNESECDCNLKTKNGSWAKCQRQQAKVKSFGEMADLLLENQVSNISQ